MLTDQAGSEQGSYWRSMGIESIVDDHQYWFQADASNSSAIEEMPVQAAVSSQFSWYTLPEGAQVNRSIIENTHDVGEAEFE